MSSKSDASPKEQLQSGRADSSPVSGIGGQSTNQGGISGNPPPIETEIPLVEGHQAVMDAIWPLIRKEVESKMIHMEQEMIKRHNIKMMNEMQEVVRQIKLAKTKNDDLLKDYQRKQTDLTRSVLEIAEKFAAMRGELEDLKRQSLINKQQFTHRCDQTTEQVGQLKQAVFTAWQKEKVEIQQKVSQSFRGDLALVLGQFDAKLKESFADISKIRYEVKKLTARMNGEDPNSVQPEVPSYVDTAVAAVSSLPPVDGQQGTPQSLLTPTQQQAPISVGATDGSEPAGGMNMASLTQNLAAFIARQSAGGAPPQVNVAMLQQFMQTLPRQQQLQLQTLLQQHRAAQQQQQQQSSSAAVTPPTSVTPPPSAPPGLGGVAPATSPPAAAPPSGPAATMIQSLAQQLQLQVNAAQQKASTSGPGTVNCPFFAMFGWCKFGDRCRYVHQATGKEPLRNLPQAVIQTLQTQLASGATADTTQTLMTALAGLAAKQGQGQQASQAPVVSTTPAPVTTSGGQANAVQQAMITAQIQAQQEAATMGAAKAKLIPCRFFAIGRCAYGDRCAYSHGNKDASSAVAAAAAAAWGQTDLNQATWGGPVSAPQESEDANGLIMDGEDDTNYDQWNAMTFDDSSAPPPGL
jgi:hypothetical protein